MKYRHILTLLSLAASLGSTTAQAGSGGLTLWHNLSPDVIASFTKRFTRQTGIEIATTWFRGEDYAPALLERAQKDGLPDVALVPADLLALDNELNFSEIPADVQSKGIIKNALEAAKHDGRVLGAPVSWGNHLMLFYNRVHVQTPAATFEQLEEQAPGFKAKGIHPLAVNFREMYWFVPFMGAYGGWPLDDEGRPSLNKPATSYALAFYFDLARKGITLKDCDARCPLDRFARGEFAYAIGGDWMYRELTHKLGHKLGVATLPSIDKKTLTPMHSAYLLVFPKNSLNGKRHRQLVQLIEYMQSRETQKAILTEAGMFPVDERLFERAKAHASPNLRMSLRQLKLARAMPNDRAMKHIWIGMARGFNAMYDGRANEKEAAVLMQRYTIKAKRQAD